MRLTRGLRHLIGPSTKRASKPAVRLAGVLLCGMPMIVAAPVQAAQSGRSAHFDIPAQGLAAAIDQFARQAGIQILYPYKIAAARRSTALRGEMPIRAALDRLLLGS